MNKRLNIIFIISIISIIFNIILAAAKIFIGIEISSQTIISDAIHSASDVLSTIIIMIGAVIANKQADENHPYGHERFEEIGAIILGCILFFTGFEITQSAIVSLINNDYSIKNLFNDINLIFDSVSGEKYTTKDLSIRDYPDPSSGYLDDLNRNDKVTLLGYNHRGYYKIKYNNTEGFIHGDYLSDEKTIGITVPAHFTAYISRAFNIGINTRHSI